MVTNTIISIFFSRFAVLLLATLINLSILFSGLYLLQHQYWLGFDFQTNHSMQGVRVSKVYGENHPLKVGEQVLSIRSAHHDAVLLNANTVIADIYNIPRYPQHNAVLLANNKLYQILKSSVVFLTTTHSEIRLQPEKRPMSSLSYHYWLPNITAFIALWVGIGIWNYQRQRLETCILALSGLSFSIGIMLTIIYSSRNLSLEPQAFTLLLSMQYLTLGGFGFILLTLLFAYPSRLLNSFGLFFIGMILPFCFWLNQQLQLFELPLHSFYFNSIFALFIAIPASIYQWRKAKYNPINKAGLRWFFISVFTAPIIAISFYLLPPVFGQQPMLPLWVTLMLFLVLFLGFALGVARYRLFDIERWWFKIWMWFIAGLMMIAIDLMLIYFIHLDKKNALTFALIITAWLYFPARQWLWQRIFTMPTTELEYYLPPLIHTLSRCSTLTEQQQAWKKVLHLIFQPLSISQQQGKLGKIRLLNHGMSLLIPHITLNNHASNKHASIYLVLTNRSEGTRLFTTTDIQLSVAIHQLALEIIAAQQAREKGARVERHRIARDLHDDVGANLLTLIYRAETDKQADLACDTVNPPHSSAMHYEWGFLLRRRLRVHCNSTDIEVSTG